MGLTPHVEVRLVDSFLLPQGVPWWDFLDHSCRELPRGLDVKVPGEVDLVRNPQALLSVSL